MIGIASSFNKTINSFSLTPILSFEVGAAHHGPFRGP